MINSTAREEHVKLSSSQLSRKFSPKHDIHPESATDHLLRNDESSTSEFIPAFNHINAQSICTPILNPSLTQSLHLPRHNSKTRERPTLDIIKKAKKTSINSVASCFLEDSATNVLRSIIIPYQTLSFNPEELCGMNGTIKAAVESTVQAKDSCVFSVASEAKANAVSPFHASPKRLNDKVDLCPEGAARAGKRELQLFEDFLVIGGDLSELPGEIAGNEILLSLIHICRCRRYAVCRSRWSPYH
eukprot:TRINITY_DN5668_c0_g2_i1.p1 TRINITY_DN5668_c0_g2~~TRINITY_DN5668_c0_g2_i1.p1  ORF type:complete len:245 (-),score=25.58 TRINITY_DN5668_c0_g2_i1:24-758(-)